MRSALIWNQTYMFLHLKNKSVLLLIIMLLSSGKLQAEATITTSGQTSLPVDRPSSAVEPVTNGFIARNKSVEYVFKALSAEMKKPVVVSTKAKKYSVTGNFNLNHPAEILSRIANDLGLIWYYDGSIYYVYEAAEVKTAIVHFPRYSYNDLMLFLKENHLYDSRYPVKMNYPASTLYVSGPPKYVDIISAIANFMGETPHDELSKQVIETIKLRHAFVDDRFYDYRDRQITVKGIASTISELLNDSTLASRSQSVSVIKGDTEDSKKNITETGSVSHSALVSTGSADKESIKILPFTTRNSLVIKGTRAQVNMIKDLIASLDIPRKQIELSLWIIDINKSDIDELGVDWKGQIELGSNALGLLNTGSILSGPQQTWFLATIMALSKQQKANVVSRPVLLVQENMPALFDNARSFYVKLTGEREVALQTVSYGTTINVTPMISDDNRIVEMSLNIMDGSTLNDGKGNVEQVDNLPVVGNTTISTVARVNEGQSLLIGGYTRDQLQVGNSKIPFLGDIPVLGYLFKGKSSGVHKSVRLFLIQPRVLSDNNQSDTSTDGYINEGWDAVKHYAETNSRINRDALINR